MEVWLPLIGVLVGGVVATGTTLYVEWRREVWQRKADKDAARRQWLIELQDAMANWHHAVDLQDSARSASQLAAERRARFEGADPSADMVANLQKVIMSVDPDAQAVIDNLREQSEELAVRWDDHAAASEELHRRLNAETDALRETLRWVRRATALVLRIGDAELESLVRECLKSGTSTPSEEAELAEPLARDLAVASHYIAVERRVATMLRAVDDH